MNVEIYDEKDTKSRRLHREEIKKKVRGRRCRDNDDEDDKREDEAKKKKYQHIMKIR